MDAFVKVRRNRYNAREEQKDCHDPKASTKSGSPADRKSTWPVYFPTCSLGAHPSSEQELDEITSYASSGCIPSFSSGYEDSDDQSRCSSPLTCSVDSSQCDDLEDAIERAELCSNSYGESLSLAVVMRRSQSDSQDPTEDTTQEPQKPAGSRGAIISTAGHKSPVFMLSSDLFAEVMGFLDPPETLRVLTMPLCKEWRGSYASHQDLWKVLCGFKPFQATECYDSDDSESFCSLAHEPMVNDIFGKYRLKYTSFVRCIQYLARIKEDDKNGRPPSVIDYGQRGFPNFGVSKGLKKYLSSSKGASGRDGAVENQEELAAVPIGVSDDGYSTDQGSRKRPPSTGTNPVAKKPRFVGPAADETPSHLSIPQSCAIYSIVNWMVAFPDVEGIQVCCYSILEM
jgi:hypothetical protein